MVFKFLRKKAIPRVPPPPPGADLPSFPSAKKLEKRPWGKEIKGLEIEIPLKHKKEIMEKEKAELETREAKKPIFMNVHAYKEMVDEIGRTKSKLEESEDMVKKIEDLKEDEDRAFGRWYGQVKDVQEKLIFVDEILFKK